MARVNFFGLIKRISGLDSVVTPATTDRYAVDQADGTARAASPADIGGGMEINNISDVDATSPNDGDALFYSTTTGKWESSAAADLTPVGTIDTWDKSMPGAPALTSYWKEMDGSVISDAASPFNGYRIRNMNGANVVLTLTWTSDAGGAYATVPSTDITALAVGDDVSGTGIAANSYISDITGTTVTITDTAASGSISSTFTNDGDFTRGGSVSNTGQKDAMQGHIVYSGYAISAIQPLVYGGTTNDMPGGATQTVARNAEARTYQAESSGPKTDGVNGTPRTDSETRPKNRTMVYIQRIK